MQLGKYARTVQPGIQFTLPAPFENITKIDTKQIQTTSIGSPKPSSENLVLSKDQSIIDMAYDVRWSIKNPSLYLFQLDNPDRVRYPMAQQDARHPLLPQLAESPTLFGVRLAAEASPQQRRHVAGCLCDGFP